MTMLAHVSVLKVKKLISQHLRHGTSFGAILKCAEISAGEAIP